MEAPFCTASSRSLAIKLNVLPSEAQRHQGRQDSLQFLSPAAFDKRSHHSKRPGSAKNHCVVCQCCPSASVLLTRKHQCSLDHGLALFGKSRHASRMQQSRGGRVKAQLEGFEDDEFSSKIAVAPPPTTDRVDIRVDNTTLRTLDLTPAHDALRAFLGSSGDASASGRQDLMKRTVGFQIDYVPVNPLDPRELSEFPDVRLWFVRLDAEYPWLPVVLDWKAGEWARYAAMLVPHQMTKKDGLVFNPEALELFVMNKMFHAFKWLKENGLKPETKCRDMVKMLGFNVDPLMFEILDGKADQKVIEERSKEDKYQVGGRLDDILPPPPPPKGSGTDYISF